MALYRLTGLTGRLITILQDIQDEYKYPDKEVLIRMAKDLNIPVSGIYSIASFYTAFSLIPRRKYVVRSNVRLLKRVREILKVNPGQTTLDKLFYMKTVNCPRTCAPASLMVIDDKYYRHVRLSKVEKILGPYKKEKVASS
ncbi:MAG: NAD(P)H-dependent oxidoreductase subunit E [Candidatus Eremiobacteraeota bacterium]|nr:NAD(P)H-dependent oxidoreductase subunit E [Candidatus Eremiobacteraeota bacterium]